MFCRPAAAVRLAGRAVRLVVMGSRRASPLAVAARKRTDQLALAQEHGEAGFGGQPLPECVRGSPGRPVG